MQRPIWRVAVALAAAVGIAVACGGGEDPPATEDELLLSAAPRQINDQGQASQLTITATNADGTKGTGTVTLKAAAGGLGNSATEETVTLTDGKALSSFTCNKAADARCTGAIRIDATWKNSTSSASVQVGSGGGTDGGTNPPPPPADGGTGTGDGGVKLSVVASKSTLFTNVGDFSEITATLTQTDGGPRAGELITFDTNLGALQVGSDAPAATVQAPTGSTGTAVVRLVEGSANTAGTANVRARHTASGANATVPVKITNIQQITHVSTMCGGQNCTIMGVNGSGFNEQAQVGFKVVDSSGNPATGVSVSFSIPNAPTGTTVSPSGVTNSQGIATATVSAGPVIGAIVVKAVAIPNRVQVDSANIGIRGAKVANQGFSLLCDLVNIGAYAAASPPAPYNVNCRVKVVDRYNNPVGTGTTVNFKVEAGNIENATVTKAYTPTGSNVEEGTGVVRFNTTGGTNFPVDVPPLDADPNQSPFPREPEPRGPYGNLVGNPRDGLVTIIAYTRGEEWFDDTNSNGARDSGEQFIDQGEPFVDSNDNGVRDTGETYIDEAPADGQWNGPNGTWDNNTSIWTETRMLYTGRPSGLAGRVYITPNVFSGNCPGGVARGSVTYVSMFFADDFFNRPQAQGTSFVANHTATKGSVRVISQGLLDDYGFGMERRLLNTSNGVCVASSPVCQWRMLFTDWDRGFVSDAEIKGAPITDTQPCQNDSVSLGTTVLNVTTFSGTTGAIQ